MTKKVRETNERIDTEQGIDGTWIGRLSLDGIELECSVETPDSKPIAEVM